MLPNFLIPAGPASKTRQSSHPHSVLALAVLLLLAASFDVRGAQVALSWQDNANNETGFKIERAMGTGAYAQIGTTATNLTSYTDTTAGASTTYNYRVCAYNSAGNSAYSNVASSTPASGGSNTAPTISDVAHRTINEDASTGAIAFTIGDMETAAGSLTVSGSASNASLVPNGAIFFGGSGASRTIAITPATNQTGSATITIAVSDGTLTAIDTFTLTVNPVNDAPAISSVANQTIVQNSATSALPLTVSDVETAAGSLTVSGSSSNPTLLPNTGIVFGGSGANRTAVITPRTAQSGSATITLTVSDGALTATNTFTLTVTAVASGNSAPTISDMPNRTISSGGNTGAIAFTIGDVETAAANLTVSGASSNPSLVPNAGITFGGSGANRIVTITPAAGGTGAATITITVSDGAMIRTDSFVLNVGSVAPVNQPPTITAIPDQAGQIDGSIGPVTFTIADNETAAAGLSASATSSNPAVVPLSGISLGGSGATRHVTITPAPGQTGSATITLTVSDGSSAASTTFTVTIAAPSPAGARLLNLSTRVVCRSNQEALIPGFVIDGTTNKRVLLRAVGPTLSVAPFNLPGALSNPRMMLKRWDGTAFVDVASNDNWSTNANATEIRQVSAEFFAFAIPDNSLDAVLLLDLTPGRYTVLVDDASGGNGVVILELYDAQTAPNGADFINLSTRGYVGDGADVMICGFVVSDEGPKTLLVRAVGPGLAPFNVPNTLSDPSIEIRRRNSDGTDTLILTRDNWGEGGDAAVITEIAAQVFAFPLSNGSKDAACVETFAPGVYTAVVRGLNGATGTALVEIYSVE